MKLPFADLFLKAKARFAPAPRPKIAAPLPSLNKPESERLRKTVLPNSARATTSTEAQPEPESEEAVSASVPDATNRPAGTSASAAEIATETAVAPKTQTVPRRISMGQPAAAAPDLPPAVAVALAPEVERVLSLPLADVIAQMPDGYLKPRESFDLNRRVLLKAAEVEKGMATGRPAISIATVYHQVPEIFMRTVASSDGAMVALPFAKVMHELCNLPLRHDQAAEQTVPEVETPFLQVTLEDTERFGTAMPPSNRVAPASEEKTNAAHVRMEPATAETIAAAEPEAAEKFVPAPVAPPSEPHSPLPSAAVEEPLRIPFSPAMARAAEPEPRESEDCRATAPIAPDSAGQAERPPYSAQSSAGQAERPPYSAEIEEPERQAKNKFGTGEPAFPRVPASSGPPVPVSPPRPIPFRVESAEETLPAKEISVGAEPSLTLPLRPLLQSLPPMQLGGNPADVPNNTKVSFPMSLIAPQLPTGKVTVKPSDFHAALPAEYRNLFLPDAVDVPVQLPLPDVLANLPGETLKVRSDQEVQTTEEIFETPFSLKAAEDAARFAKSEERSGPKSQCELGRARPPGAPDGPAVRPYHSGRESEIEAGEGSSATLARPVSRELDPPELTDFEATAPVTAKNAGEAEQLGVEGEMETAEPAAKFDAKEVVARACAVAGVSSCSVIFADGLSIAGNVPETLHVDGLSAVAPALLQRLEKHMLQTSLGPLTGITVHGENAPVSFFAAGNICLTALHDSPELGAQSRHELAELTRKLSRAYSQSGPSRTGGPSRTDGASGEEELHVDH